MADPLHKLLKETLTLRTDTDGTRFVAEPYQAPLHAAAVHACSFAAFWDDPWQVYIRGFFPDPARGRDFMERELSALVDLEAMKGPGWVLKALPKDAAQPERVCGVMLWGAPDRWDHESFLDLIRVGFLGLLWAAGFTLGRRMYGALCSIDTVQKQYEAQHGRAYYLAFLAVDPEFQGRGLGSLLLNAAIECLDSFTTKHADLVTAKPSNIDFYRRFGFELVETHHEETGAPDLFFMARVPPPPASEPARSEPA